MIGCLFFTGGAVGLKRQIFAASNALGHPSEDIQGHSSNVHTKHRILPLIASGQFVEPRVRCMFVDQSLQIGNRIEVNESQSFELLKYWIGDNLLKNFEVLAIHLKHVFCIELIDVLRLPTRSNCESRIPRIVSGEKSAICKSPQRPVSYFHGLLMVFGCCRYLDSSINNRRYGNPSSKRADPLPETVGFIFATGKLPDREYAKKQKDQQYSCHSECNVPAQPIPLIVSLIVHFTFLLIVISRIGERFTYLQWGRAV